MSSFMLLFYNNLLSKFTAQVPIVPVLVLRWRANICAGMARSGSRDRWASWPPTMGLLFPGPGTQLFPLLWPLPYLWVEVMAQPTPVGPWYPSARGCFCMQDDLDNCWHTAHCATRLLSNHSCACLFA